MTHTDTHMIHIKRADIPAIREVRTDGVIKPLGIHQDFRRHQDLARYMPEDARLSLSWVHLEQGQELATHVHPVTSMIVVTSGTGMAIGANNTFTFTEGDVIVVPPHVQHGFRGIGATGYWALSIQFDGAGLYENKARVSFVDDDISADPFATRIQQCNAAHIEAYLSNPLFTLLNSTAIQEVTCRARMLDAIQVWSNIFQRIIHMRCALAASGAPQAMAMDHFSDEFGHNTRLSADRGDRLRVFWDAKLESYGTWFQWRMLTASETERAVLVHLVLEGGALAFHEPAHVILSQFAETNHFATHAHADQEHYNMGLAVLRGLNEQEAAAIERTIDEAWDILNLICARIAELAITDTGCQ